MTALEGYLVSGQGRASDFTGKDWVRRRLIELAGIDPHPGTLNLELRDDMSRTIWQSWRGLPGCAIEPPSSAFCRSRCYPVRIAGGVPAAVLLPEIDGYPEDKLEIVAALPIRQHLSLGDQARIRVELCGPLVARAVLFDIDGTLVDSVGAYIKVAQIAAEQYGFEVTGEHVRRALVTGINFWKCLIPPDQIDGDAVVKSMAAHASREWPHVLREYGKVFEGVVQTLDALKSLGIMLGIVSGARPEVLELLRYEGVLDRFDAIILGADVSKGKPDPEGIFTCLDRLGVAPAEAVYIGDTPLDIQASQAAGVSAVGVLTGAGDSAMLSRYCPDRLIPSQAALPAIMGLSPDRAAQAA